MHICCCATAEVSCKRLPKSSLNGTCIAKMVSLVKNQLNS